MELIGYMWELTFARKYALQNAILHDGKADERAVLGKILAVRPELKPHAKELLAEVKKLVLAVNKLSKEEQMAELESIAPELIEKKKKPPAGDKLPQLINVNKKTGVVLRFAPGPSGPLHLGHARAAILNDEYAKMYGGKLINRIEDTDPNRILPEAYEMIREDLDWLGVKVHDYIYQSDRFQIYYDHAKKLLGEAHAYVCLCVPEEWRKLKLARRACPHRNLPPETQLNEFDKMLQYTYKEEEASVIIKTDLSHPNPAVRDFVGLRIVDTLHPRTGDRYYVYPLMNFAVAIDDHLLGLTHVLRGKDHLNNTYRQAYIFDYFGWQKPEYIHYGRVSIPELVLKSSAIAEGINSGKYHGWDDIRLGTLRALAKRGIQPESLRKYWVEVGTKEVDIVFSWETLYAFNKDYVEHDANRYFFVWHPKKLMISGAERLEGHAPLHPEVPERGRRSCVIPKVAGKHQVYVVEDDLQAIKPGDKLRLKDLCNIEFTDIERCDTKYIGDDLQILKAGAKIIHWVPVSGSILTRVQMPDGSYLDGYCEPEVLRDCGKVIQFERFGFVKLDRASDNRNIIAWFAHR
jgi:glutamyl-tRNA synthetase